ncbi:histone-lysine N-methyltransferase EZ1 [Triticum aestivum]|uniref:histone-lysine N-methyltransferase EZ1 n=1 Tax=Triticum aestivum TaxID=4565 RepID=UPI001D0189EA|nr:histone-lysine N-methyltransferase EZ1-like [Triticum aestivum]
MSSCCFAREVFDCRLHGCSRDLSDKQPYGFELHGNKSPCGDQCYLRRREGFQDIRKHDYASSATHNMESRSTLHKVGTDMVSESEDSNREEEIIKSSISLGTSRSKISFESVEKHTTLPSGDAFETENVSAFVHLRHSRPFTTATSSHSTLPTQSCVSTTSLSTPCEASIEFKTDYHLSNTEGKWSWEWMTSRLSSPPSLCFSSAFIIVCRTIHVLLLGMFRNQNSKKY